MVGGRIGELLGQMTLAEKVGQMVQADRGKVSPEEAASFAVGSVLSGGGGNPDPNTPQAWADMVDAYLEAARRTRLGIPLLYGVDAVHGHANVRGATVFPHNIGLGAAGDADLTERVSAATARELMATGIRWNFAPAVSVPQDIRWGRTYEGFGERPEIAVEMGAAVVRGLHGRADGRIDVLACPKHFVGDGGTGAGTAVDYDWLDWWSGWPDNWHIDQGDTAIDEATLRATHLPPYPAALKAGARNVMASYNSWNGEKLHGHRSLLTDVLKGELGFDGFVVSDWMGVDQLDRDYATAITRAIEAGIDMIMAPLDVGRLVATTVAVVESGAIGIGRIDDAVERILRVKEELGLFEGPTAPRPSVETVGTAAHRAIAREAAARSAVLLRNEADTLPIRSTAVLVAGEAADDLGLQCGGWTVEWQGGRGAITSGTTLLAALRDGAPDIRFEFDPAGAFPDGATATLGIVVVAEEPYAEGFGDRHDLTLPADQAAIVARMRERCDRLVLVVYSGRPLIITHQVESADAVVAAWLPGSEGAGLADVLLGREPFTGRLPVTWPRSMAGVPRSAATAEEPLFPFGHGLATVTVRP